MKRFAVTLAVVGMVMLFATLRYGLLCLGAVRLIRRRATLAGHPAADTILRVPQAVAIGAAMVVAMVMAGAVAQLAVIAVWAGAVMAAIGEPLLPAVDTTTALAAAAADTTMPLSSSSSGYWPASSSSSGWY